MVSEFFYPRLAGGELVLWQLCHAFSKKGHKIDVVTSRIDNATEHEVINGIEIYRPFPSGRSLLKRFIFLVRLYLYLRKFLSTRKADIIYNLAHVPTIPATYLASRHGVPVVTGVHSFVGRGWFKLTNPILATINCLMEMLILRFGKHDVVQFPSRHSKMLAEPYLRAEGVVIYNPIDTDEMKKVKLHTDAERIRESLGLREEIFLLFVGSLLPTKNVTSLVSALSSFKGNFKLVIVGEGPEREKIERLAARYGLKEKIILLGQKPHQETLSLMASCDALVLPSKSEQFPIVVLEALALGKPVIATKVGGIPEIRSANLHLIDNLEEISEILDGGIKAEEDDGVIKEYSLDRIAQEYERLFEGLIKTNQ